MCLHKAIVLLKHLVLHGSETAVNLAWGLGDDCLPALKEYNTVLMAADNPNSVMDLFQKFKGGSVDQGMPVRAAAEELLDLLRDSKQIKRMRAEQADPNSLVPVGSDLKMAF
eukprot:scaffold227006_cov39-Attheya_sp.AAC.1